MDEPPYKEIDGDQLSSMLLNPKKIIICYRGKKIPVLSPGDDFYFWADAYDEEANIMEEVAVFWQVTPPEAVRLLPIDHLVALGCQASHAVYILVKQYSGTCKLTAYIEDSNKQRIETSIEVQIMEKNSVVQSDVSKATGSPRDAPNIKKAPEIIDVPAEKPTAPNTQLVPLNVSNQQQQQLNSQEEIERTFTQSTLTQTSIEERRRQQHSLNAQKQNKSLFMRSVEMTDPTTNKDSWASMMAYICFATAFTYFESGEYTTGGLFLVCFLVFAFAKQGLPEGPFTQWLKNRSKITISEARRTFIGDK